MARPAWNTGENIKRVLDNGGWGVILPMICSKSDAELAVDSTFYAPRGSRSVGGMLHAISFQTDPGYLLRTSQRRNPACSPAGTCQSH
jgi:4-hydroxy-2-oxoheptanedioate aldolase